MQWTNEQVQAILGQKKTTKHTPQFGLDMLHLLPHTHGCAVDGAIQTKKFLYMGKCKNHIHRIYELMRIYTGLKSKF